MIRNGFVESRHHGRVVTLDVDGRVAWSLGNIDAPVLPRSSLKPMQAAAMLDAGWQPADDAQLALATASHSGTDRHVDVVRRMLADAGLDETALRNSPDLPLDPAAAHALIRAGGGADRLRQNCSGKHAAMLATCVTNGWPLESYLDADHPVQRAAQSMIERLTGEPVAAVTVDGCGAPAYAVSLSGLARAMAELMGTRVAAAMTAWPDLVGGEERDVTRLMRAVPGLAAKDGAEGVYVAALPDRRAVALKIDDGAGRARMPVMTAALVRLGVPASSLAGLRTTPVLGHGEPVGVVTVLRRLERESGNSPDCGFTG